VGGGDHIAFSDVESGAYRPATLIPDVDGADCCFEGPAKIVKAIEISDEIRRPGTGSVHLSVPDLINEPCCIGVRHDAPAIALR
jgi:hypothetical protein